MFVKHHLLEATIFNELAENKEVTLTPKWEIYVQTKQNPHDTASSSTYPLQPLKQVKSNGKKMAYQEKKLYEKISWHNMNSLWLMRVDGLTLP